jgi:riboflavin synthase
MFTGLVEETGVVEELIARDTGTRLKIQAKVSASDIAIGDSLAVNGACLTVVQIHPVADSSSKILHFDILDETMHRTNFHTFCPGTKVNLERSMLVGARFGGHFVTGHIDEIARVETIEKRGESHYLEIHPIHAESLRYVVEKGSIALNGISLTVAGVTSSTFHVWIIPHTFELTNIQDLIPGALVNLEFDMIAKYIEKMLVLRNPNSPA